MNLAPPTIQALAYSLIWDRFVSEYAISPNVLILAAGNRLEDRASVFELNDPLKNRFSHCELGQPSIEGWTEWALLNNIDSRVITFL